MILVKKFTSLFFVTTYFSLFYQWSNLIKLFFLLELGLYSLCAACVYGKYEMLDDVDDKLDEWNN